jgi:hypothetical protein
MTVLLALLLACVLGLGAVVVAIGVSSDRGRAPMA